MKLKVRGEENNTETTFLK